MRKLSPSRRREVKARALDPIVRIGGAGLSPAVLAEIDRGLKSHELIKIRVNGADRTGREAILEEICNPKSQVEQITSALIYKFMDDMDLEAEELGGKRKFFAGDFARKRGQLHRRFPDPASVHLSFRRIALREIDCDRFPLIQYSVIK